MLEQLFSFSPLPCTTMVSTAITEKRPSDVQCGNTSLSDRCVVSVPPREKLKQLIEKRIGKENFVEKLGFITKHELYSRAAQKPQPVFPSPEQMLFDHEFTKLVKELEGP